MLGGVMADHPSQLLRSWQTFAILSALFAALTAILGKVGVGRIGSDLATFLRTIVVLVLSAAIVTLSGQWRPPAMLPRRELAFVLLSGAATGLSWLCYYRALQLGPASRVAPVDKLSVVFVILLAAAFLGEALTWRTLLGGGLIAAGAVVLAR